MILHKFADEVNEIIDAIVSRVEDISDENIHQLRRIIFDKLNDNMVYGYEAKQ
jgi:hypothetical protein